MTEMSNNTEQRKKIIRIISVTAIVFGILVIIMCTAIFMFSAQDGEESSFTSGRIVELLLIRFVPHYSEMNPDEQYAVFMRLSLYVRKGAHFSEYLLLAVLAFHLFLALPKPKGEFACAFCAQLFSSLYAVTDEYHQSLVPGRAMMARDVLIDSCGALLGLIICGIIRSGIRKRKAKKAAVKDTAAPEAK